MSAIDSDNDVAKGLTFATSKLLPAIEIVGVRSEPQRKGEAGPAFSKAIDYEKVPFRGTKLTPFNRNNGDPTPQPEYSQPVDEFTSIGNQNG